ncbi:MAG TPA: prepilin peptidase [Reyranella sp.]|jgi:prepilin peptidase CpaA|nr:prepilin peptidase [Reyranella sp.]
MSLFALLQAGCLFVFALLLVWAGWRDLRSMRIANRLSLAVVATFVVWAIAGFGSGRMTLEGLAATMLCAIALFGVGALAFAAGVLGGGDVKLLAAATLFAGPAQLLDFLTVTALAGGVLALAILAGAPIGPALPDRDGTLRARLRSGLPYGPAIAIGGLWVAVAQTMTM